MAAAGKLAATTEEILAEVQQLPAELIHWVPAEGVWTVMDNLCHIREFVPFWTGETLRIVQRPTELWGRDHTDTARLAAVTNTAAQGLADIVADIREAVRRAADTLSRLSDADLASEATSKNPRWGMKPPHSSLTTFSCITSPNIRDRSAERFPVHYWAGEAVKIRIIGGGPAGLFFAYLMGRAQAGHDIRVYERDPEGATYGWGSSSPTSRSRSSTR